ncbi:MAG: translation initiation factor IF-2 [Thermoleophilaceae bacterium]|nr:translation initiation factor IF-2 [Thermoleophilaceae bacterium]
MAKVRVHELAKQANISSKEMLALLQKAGIDVKTASSGVSDEVADKVMKAVNRPVGARAASGRPPAQRSNGSGGQSRPQQRSFSAAPGDAPPRRGPSGTPGGSGSPGGGRPGGSPAGGGSAGAGGKMRRVVIDSQAARRGPGGPPQSQPARKPRGGRRRRPVFEEPVEKVEDPELEALSKIVRIDSGATVKEVSESLGVSSAEVIKKLMELGEMASLTQTLSDETIAVVVESFERELDLRSVSDESDEPTVAEDEAADLVERPPVVTIMGHVDHGKTSLLDAVREADVVAGEAGGITQHIGAYQVHRGDKLITFIDTPGHEAFTAMRARGAKVTDVAVIVVAADDGVMPQTEEAIDHAKAAGVPIVIAVNKIDKEGADPTKVRTELAAMGFQPEDWGGETIFCDVSAKKKEGLENLLDMLLLVAEVEELKGNPDSEASGTVIESQLDPGRGAVATLLLQRGQLKIGDAIVAGSTWGRVRAMNDYNGHRIELAELGAPVEVLGFDGVPEAGNTFRVVESDRIARSQAADRAHRLKNEAIARRARLKVSFEDAFARAQEGELSSLNLILKGDVAGSVGALEDEIAKLPQSEIKVNVIHHGVGGINESDIMLASASDAIVIGFNVRPVGDSRLIADREGVEIRTYTIIYKAIEELRAAMQGLLAPEEVEQAVGTLTVRQTFKASKIGTIAGCHVDSGKVLRGSSVRLVRDGTVVYEGRINTLRRFDDDAKEVTVGMECGVVLEKFADVKEEDVIEVFETKSVERELV